MTIAITGNTYPVKDQIKALGGKWDANSKSWMVPDDKAEQARSLVSPAKSQHPMTTPHVYRPTPKVNQPCRKCGSYCYGDCEAN